MAVGNAVIGALRVNLGMNSAEFSKGVKTANRQVSRFSRRTTRTLRKIALQLTGAFAVTQGVRGFARMSDSITQINTRLKLVTKSSKELRDVQASLFKISQDTRADFSSTVDAYARVARSATKLGIEQQSVLRFTELVQKAIAISGATAQEASAGFIQLAQGIASNRLGGEELRSVLEQMPRVAIAIAEGIDGVRGSSESAVGFLRRISKEGKLTGDVVIKSMLAMGNEIDKEFTDVNRTIGQAMVQLKNQWLKSVAGSGGMKPVTDIFIEVIDELKEAITNQEFQNGVAVFAGFIGKIATLGSASVRALGVIGKTAEKLAFLGGVAGDIIFGKPANKENLEDLENDLKRFTKFVEFDSSKKESGFEQPEKAVPDKPEKPKLDTGTSTSRKDRSGADLLNGIQQRIRAIQNETKSLTMGEGAIAKMFEKEQALAFIKTNNIKLTSKQGLALEGYLNKIQSVTDELEREGLQLERLNAVGSTVTDTLTSAFDQFAQSGKISVKGMVSAMLRDLARLQFSNGIQSLFGSFGGGQKSSGLFGLLGGALGGSPLGFAGLFADGGKIPSGQFGVVGERGPEFISGPANITPINRSAIGGTQRVHVTVGISADNNGNIRPFVESVARNESAAAAAQVARSVPALVDARNSERETRRIRASR